MLTVSQTNYWLQMYQGKLFPLAPKSALMSQVMIPTDSPQYFYILPHSLSSVTGGRWVLRIQRYLFHSSCTMLREVNFISHGNIYKYIRPPLGWPRHSCIALNGTIFCSSLPLYACPRKKPQSSKLYHENIYLVNASLSFPPSLSESLNFNSFFYGLSSCHFL